MKSIYLKIFCVAALMVVATSEVEAESTIINSKLLGKLSQTRLRNDDFPSSAEAYEDWVFREDIEKVNSEEESDLSEKSEDAFNEKDSGGQVEEVHRCSLPLGMENGKIRDGAISASSTASFSAFPASRSRLNTGPANGAWIAAANDGKQWLKIDLGEVARITRVVTQGRADSNQWTLTYSLSYSIDGIHWANFKTTSYVKVFSGNTDRNSLVGHNLIPYIEARHVRFNVLTAQSRPALRVELYGCRKVHSCAVSVGIEDGRIPDGSLTASSFLSSAFSSTKARLNLQATAWIPKTQSTSQYLKIDLVQIHSVTKVSTQGRYNVDQYVKKYTLSSSFDGSNWILYKTDGYNVNTFVGNNDGNTPVSHVLNPRIEGRYIQFNPQAWQSYIAMRVEVYGCKPKRHCHLPLGIQDGRILNSQLSGTSSTAASARLTGASAFIANANDVNQFLQVDFIHEFKVTGIALQGRPTATQYVKTYSVSYSVDGSHWAYVRHHSLIKVFSGNNDRNSISRNFFSPAIFTRLFKVHPKTWQSHIAFRMELYGCATGDSCSRPLGIEDGRLEDLFITASSFYNNYYKPQYGRLNNVKSGSNRGSWLAKVNDANQFLQVDLGKRTMVTKVAIQGRYDGNSFVRSFTLSYSQDGSHWAFYRLNNVDIKIFGGVADKQTVRFNDISPSIVAHYVRVNPRSWFGHIAMRMELYGCYVDTCSTPLGVEDRRVSDVAMTASSEYSAKFAAKFGRLNIKNTGNNYGAWCSKANNNKQWLQVELSELTAITKIAIQGRKDAAQWVTSFTVQFSDNGSHFADYKQDGQTVIFPGNFDQNTIQVYNFATKIYAKFLRVKPLTWRGYVCLRLELYGCIAQGLGNMAINAK